MVVIFLYNYRMRVFCYLFSVFLLFGYLFADDEDGGNDDEEAAEEVLNENEEAQEESDESGEESFQNNYINPDQEQYRTKRYVRNLVDNILGGFVPDSRTLNDKNYQNTTQINNKINLLSKDLLELQKYLTEYNKSKNEDTERAARFRADMQKALERFLGYELSESSEKKLKTENSKKSPQKSKKKEKTSAEKSSKVYRIKKYGAKAKNSSTPRRIHSIFTVKNVNIPENYQNSYIGKPMPKIIEQSAKIASPITEKPIKFKVKYYGAQGQETAAPSSQDIDMKGKKWTVKTGHSHHTQSTAAKDNGYFKKCPTCGSERK